MSEHTPGPWAAAKTDGYVVCDLTAGWSVVATEADPNKHSPEADAWLIAAAPDMLKMLEDIALEIRRGQDISEWYSEIADTIEKAKGEQE